MKKHIIILMLLLASATILVIALLLPSRESQKTPQGSAKVLTVPPQTVAAASSVPTPDNTVPTPPSMKDTQRPTQTTAPASGLEDDALVNVKVYIPTAFFDIRYATKNNFTGQIIYESDAAMLRLGTVKKLQKVQSELAEMGLSLLIWDAYRPVSAQFLLWEICPDPTYVADPSKGYSSHSYGNTIDVSLIELNGNAVEMPSEFDDFSTLADRDYSDATKEAAKNARLLEELMTKYGFTGYSAEWWHYRDSRNYPVIEN